MAKKTKKSAEKNVAQNTAPRRHAKKATAPAVETVPGITPKLSVAKRGSAQVQPLVRLLQGRGFQGQRRMRLQDSQERNTPYAPAQSPLRSYHIPKHLRTPQGLIGYAVVLFPA